MPCDIPKFVGVIISVFSLILEHQIDKLSFLGAGSDCLECICIVLNLIGHFEQQCMDI